MKISSSRVKNIAPMSSSSPPSTTTYPSPKSTPKPLNRPSSHPHPPPKEIFKSLFNQKTHVPTHYEQMLQKLAHKFASLYEDLKSHKTSKPQSIKKPHQLVIGSKRRSIPINTSISSTMTRFPLWKRALSSSPRWLSTKRRGFTSRKWRIGMKWSLL